MMQSIHTEASGETARDVEFPHLRIFAAALAAAGVRDVCIAPGARSTPLALSLTRQQRLRCHSHVDERSAAFFALGCAVAGRAPAALLCTSGSAAANFFPAVVEAACAGVPLVVLTADRPAELRDREADQTIDQIHLYGRHAKWFADVGPADCGPAYFADLARRAVSEAAGVPAGVAHLNFPLREPLLAPPGLSPADAPPVPPRPPLLRRAPHPAGGDIARLAERIAATPRGLILCGPADHDDAARDAIAALAARSGYPILADPTSQLRRARYADAVVQCYDGLVADAAADRLAPALVLRIGKLPTSKRLRLWLQGRAVPHFVVDPRGRWNDPTAAAEEIWPTDIAATCIMLSATLDAALPQRLDSRRWRAAWADADGRARAAIADVAGAAPRLCGVGVFHRLARLLPTDAVVYVGNSLPIRQLEAAWPADAGAVRFLCNRGANGIDGLVSSILGAAAASDAPVVGVIGDLSFYHDLNGLLAARRRRIDATIVVLNNDGGGIFSLLPMAQLGATFDEFFTTPHGLDFRSAAQLYGCAFDRPADWQEFAAMLRRAISQPGTNIIEVPLDRDADLAVTRSVTAAVAAAAWRGD